MISDKRFDEEMEFIYFCIQNKNIIIGYRDIFNDYMDASKLMKSNIESGEYEIIKNRIIDKVKERKEKEKAWT